MKYLSVLLLILCPIFLFPQGKRVFGRVFNELKKTNKGVYIIRDSLHKKRIYQENVDIYLLERPDDSCLRLYITKIKNSTFNFTICNDDLKNYNYIEFSKDNYNKIIQIKSLNSDSLMVCLEPLNHKIDRMLIVRELPLIIGEPIMINDEKPAIYLYPSQKEDVTVKLRFKGKVVNTYPQYNDAWKVEANPDGRLLNHADNRNYNYLFWDGVYSFPKEHYNYKSGFIVKRNEYISFLQTKLSLLGLNETEINDFIVYWLPRLNNNEQSLIHFWVNDNIDNSAFLDIEPKPDTEIRVFMEFKKAEKNQTIEEQKLLKLQRKGFTVVEWGGSDLSGNKIE